jgi:hypothetical protein
MSCLTLAVRADRLYDMYQTTKCKLCGFTAREHGIHMPQVLRNHLWQRHRREFRKEERLSEAINKAYEKQGEYWTRLFKED